MNWFDSLSDGAQGWLLRLLEEPTGADAKEAAGGDTTYGCWLLATDLACRKRIGVSVFDLADMNTRDWYEDELSPAQALQLALKEEGWTA